MSPQQTLTILLLIFSPISAFSQAKETRLSGYLGVEGGESYTYKLDFIDSGGYIKGYSYTYLFENKEVKAAITGKLDKTNKTLAFKETSIIYNHGFESNTTICLINALLTFKSGSDGGKRFTGAITSNDVGNVYCGQGTVSFPATDDLARLFKDEIVQPQAIAVPSKPHKPMKFVYDTIQTQSQSHVETPEPERQIAKITAGVEKVLEWHSDSVIIKIWDGGRIDGDVVSVLVNNAPLLSRYTLAKTPKILRFALTGDAVSSITVIAENEGNEPPNSANIVLVDGSTTHPVIAYNKTGKSATIKIKRAKR
jgi:hypothetical protein